MNEYLKMVATRYLNSQIIAATAETKKFFQVSHLRIIVNGLWALKVTLKSNLLEQFFFFKILTAIILVKLKKFWFICNDKNIVPAMMIGKILNYWLLWKI